MISAHGLVKTFDPEIGPVIKNLSLEIKNGDFVSLMGRSGSGKSTLLYLLSTLDRDFEGDVAYDGKNIKNLGVNDVHEIRNSQIGFVFQFHYLIAELSALENVLLPARKAKDHASRVDFAKELLKDVGLEGKENRLPANLSGGEQQRVAIARALVMKPTYLFADEPTGNLDSANGEIIMNLFAKYNREFGISIVYVTHDHDFAQKASRKIQLVDGVIV